METYNPLQKEEEKLCIYNTSGNFANWCIAQHAQTNHFYGEGGYIPYRFHLEMVVQEVKRHLAFNASYVNKNPEFADKVIKAAWGHDTMEDTRVTYNDVIKACGRNDKAVAEIIYALTNEKGRNRAERANDKYYKGIRETEGASFVKFCDRIANVKYSKMFGSSMFEMYRKENEGFIEKCYTEDLAPYKLKGTLLSLFE